MVIAVRGWRRRKSDAIIDSLNTGLSLAAMTASGSAGWLSPRTADWPALGIDTDQPHPLAAGCGRGRDAHCPRLCLRHCRRGDLEPAVFTFCPDEPLAEDLRVMGQYEGRRALSDDRIAAPRKLVRTHVGAALRLPPIKRRCGAFFRLSQALDHAGCAKNMSACCGWRV